MYIMNLGKPTKVAKLNETMAIELGANLMGEVIIFSVAGSCLILEYNRQVAKEAKKEEARCQQIQEFIDGIEKLNRITFRQAAEIQYLQEAIVTLANKTKHTLPKKPPIPEMNEQLNICGEHNRNVNADGNVEKHNKENGKRSLVERAIVYYENNVKADRIS